MTSQPAPSVSPATAIFWATGDKTPEQSDAIVAKLRTAGFMLVSRETIRSAIGALDHAAQWMCEERPDLFLTKEGKVRNDSPLIRNLDEIAQLLHLVLTGQQ